MNQPRLRPAPDQPPLDVVTFGEAMVGLIPDDGRDLALSNQFGRHVVSAETNVAVGLARLGRQVGWFGRLGQDKLGEGVLRTLRGEGVDISRVLRDPHRATGLLLRDVLPDRPAHVAYFRTGSAGSALAPADIDEDYLTSGRILHLTGITPVLSDSAWQATRLAMRVARAAGMIIAFDPNLRRSLCSDDVAIPRLCEIAQDCDIVLAGVDELRAMTTETDPEVAARRLLKDGPSLVVVKDGRHGSSAFDGHQSWQQDVWPITAVDPVGAGDAYAAGFLHSWLDGRDVAKALRTGSITSALVVATRGDTDGLPSLSDLEAIEKGETDVKR